MSSGDNEANKNTGESSTQLLASSKQTELEYLKRIKRERNNEAAKRTRENKLRVQKDLQTKVNILNVKKNSMSSKLSNLKDEIKVLMDKNKELKNQVDVTKYLAAEIQTLKAKLPLNQQMTLEIQQLNVATSDIQSIYSNINQQQTSHGYMDQSDTSTMVQQPSNDKQQISPGYLDEFDTFYRQFMNPNW